MYIVITTFKDDTQEVHIFYTKEGAQYAAKQYKHDSQVDRISIYQTTSRSLCVPIYRRDILRNDLIA